MAKNADFALKGRSIIVRALDSSGNLYAGQLAHHQLKTSNHVSPPAEDQNLAAGDSGFLILIGVFDGLESAIDLSSR